MVYFAPKKSGRVGEPDGCCAHWASIAAEQHWTLGVLHFILTSMKAWPHPSSCSLQTCPWEAAQVKSDPHSYVWLSQLWISTIGGSISYFRHPEYKPKPVYHLSWPRQGNLMVDFGITVPPQAQWRNLPWPTLFCMQTRKSCRSVSQALASSVSTCNLH